MRGKVLAAYIMFLTLAMPLGTLAQGALADVIGARATVAGAGALFLLATWWLRLGTTYVRAMDNDRVEVEADVEVAAVPVDPQVVPATP
jgi:hypothetical protein